MGSTDGLCRNRAPRNPPTGPPRRVARRPNRPQRAIRSHPLLEINIGEQLSRPLVRSPHHSPSLDAPLKSNESCATPSGHGFFNGLVVQEGAEGAHFDLNSTGPESRGVAECWSRVMAAEWSLGRSYISFDRPSRTKCHKARTAEEVNILTMSWKTKHPPRTKAANSPAFRPKSYKVPPKGRGSDQLGQ